MGINRDIGIGLLGLGVVGSRVVEALQTDRKTLQHIAGRSMTIRRVLVRDKDKTRRVTLAPELMTTDPQAILDDPLIEIVVELMGGEQPALELTRKALIRGKNVVTANKEMIAKHGPELLNIANQTGVSLLFEASVGGGIPIIGPLTQNLMTNEILAINAIINGTTNYILTRMSQDGLDFTKSLAEAQSRGYAESDPRNDVEGIDAAYKMVILATLTFHTPVRMEDIFCEGVTRLGSKDFRYARELGYAIKLLAIARRVDGHLELRVHPAFIAADHPLAKVDGVYNAIEIHGNLVGKVMFHGLGAGASPTTSSVLADIVNIGRRIADGEKPLPIPYQEPPLKILPIDQIVTRYYLRLNVNDEGGVLAQIAYALGRQGISISTVIQKDTMPEEQTAEIVIMTHPAQEKSMRQALKDLESMPIVKKLNNIIRVENL